MTMLYDKVYQVSGGNPEALRVISDCLKLASSPQEQFSILSAMESVGWQGSKIWEVFKDDADQDLAAFLRLLASESLRLFTAEVKAIAATSEMGGDR